MVPLLVVSVLWGSLGLVSTLAPAAASASGLGAAAILLGGALLLTTAPNPVTLVRGASPSERALLALGSVTALGFSQAYYPAVRLLGVAPVTVITLGSAPLFAGALARFALHRPLPPRWPACAPLAVLGCVLLVAGGPEHLSSGPATPADTIAATPGRQALGVALAVAPGLAYAITSTIAGHSIARGRDSRDVMGTMYGGAAVLALAVLAAGGAVTSAGLGWLLTARGLAVVGFLGVVITYGCYHAMGRALHYVTAEVATLFTIAEAAIGALLGVGVRGERLSFGGWAGLGLLALALSVLSLPARSRPRSRPVPHETG